MAHIPQEIRAKRGDQVLPKWRALIKFLEDALQVNLGPGMRERKIGDGGRYIWAASDIKSFAYPFKVSVSATEARVSEGTVNGVFPYIEDVRINGLDDDDNPVSNIKDAVKNYVTIFEDGEVVEQVEVWLNGNLEEEEFKEKESDNSS